MMKRITILGTVFFFIALLGSSWYFFSAPQATCFDGKQNQGERGVDCGGPCAHSCEVVRTPEALVIRESAFVPGGKEGEYDVMAKIYNPNDELGAAVLPYAFRLEDGSGNTLAEASGTGFILPQETKTFLLIGLKASSMPRSVSVTFPEAQWEKFSGYQEKPSLSIINKRYAPVTSGPFFGRAEGTLVNDSIFDFRSVLVKVILRDASGKPLAFNQTEMNTVRTRESRDFQLTWPKAFVGEVAQVDVEPEADVYHEENFVRQYVEPGKFQDLR